MSGVVSIRLNKNNKGWGRWKRLEIGEPGDLMMTKDLGSFGSCHTAQWEIEITDDVQLELVALQWKRTPLG